jgi:hypothetical protein
LTLHTTTLLGFGCTFPCVMEWLRNSIEAQCKCIELAFATLPLFRAKVQSIGSNPRSGLDSLRYLRLLTSTYTYKVGIGKHGTGQGRTLVRGSYIGFGAVLYACLVLYLPCCVVPACCSLLTALQVTIHHLQGRAGAHLHPVFCCCAAWGSNFPLLSDS